MWETVLPPCKDILYQVNDKNVVVLFLSKKLIGCYFPRTRNSLYDSQSKDSYGEFDINLKSFDRPIRMKKSTHFDWSFK